MKSGTMFKSHWSALTLMLYLIDSALKILYGSFLKLFWKFFGVFWLILDRYIIKRGKRIKRTGSQYN